MFNHPHVKRAAARLTPLIPAWLYRVLVGLTQARFNVGATGWVFDPQGRVLLLHHVYRRRFPWGPPGGWLKPGEDPATALARELREETGLAACVHRPLYVAEMGGTLDIVYLATTPGGPLRLSSEILDGGFFDPAAIPYPMLLHHEQALLWAVAAWGALLKHGDGARSDEDAGEGGQART